MCITSYLQSTEDNLRESVLPFHCVDFGDRTDRQAWYWSNTFTLWAIALARAEVLIIGLLNVYRILTFYLWRYTAFVVTVSHLKQMNISLEGTATASIRGGTTLLEGFDALAWGGRWLAQRWGGWSLGPRRRHKSWMWQMGKIQKKCAPTLHIFPWRICIFMTSKVSPKERGFGNWRDTDHSTTLHKLE